MSSLIFVDIIAYSGASIGVLLLFFIGLMLQRTRSAASCLSLLIGDERALECMREGSFKAGRMQAFGSLCLLFASFIAISILRAFK